MFACSAIYLAQGYLPISLANIIQRQTEQAETGYADSQSGKSDIDLSGSFIFIIQLFLHLNDGNEIYSDIVILSIGVRPETKLAKECGLELGQTGGIHVNQYMQTSDESIYALGDATEIINYVTKKPALIPLAGPANKQGRIVANNIILGNRETYNVGYQYG